MIGLIRYDEQTKWNNLINSFKKTDVYYTCEYAVSFMQNETGIPYLLHYEGKGCRLCYSIVEKDVADFTAFKGSLSHGKYFDWNTPYGYGGPLADVDRLTDAQQSDFRKELYALASDKKVITQFVRFHPLLQNQLVCDKVIENDYIKDTIFINLDTQEDLMIQMDSKNRNLIRKAMKNDIVVKHDSGNYINEFKKIYETTMDRDRARSFYYFPESYYEYMKENMGFETEYFYAYKEGVIVAASVFFYNEKYMHYHLSGNLVEYRTFAPTNLLLYEAANWGREKGIKALHLGGGVGIEDSLFHFKKQFNKNGRIPFYIGRNIFMPEKYQELLYKRREVDSDFDLDNSYYIQYRKPEE